MGFIFNYVIIPILLMLVWEFLLRDPLLSIFRRIKYYYSRLLNREMSTGKMLQKLSLLCQGDDKTKIIMQLAQHSGLTLDGCFEILHSHQYKGWKQHEIEFLPLGRSVPSPPDLRELMEKFRPSPPNNGKYRLYQYIPDSSERPNLQIQLAVTDYFSTYPIQQKLFEKVLPDGHGGFRSPLEKYGQRLLEFGDHPLPNIVCLHTLIVLPGDKLLVTQRIESQDRIDWEQGKWSCSFEEQMTIKIGEPRNDNTFFDTVYAGCHEELGLSKKEIKDVRILSIVVDSASLSVNPIALVCVEANIEDIKYLWSLKARDGVNRELKNIAQIEWTPEAVLPILQKQVVQFGEHEIKIDEWHSTSRMRFLVSLFYRYGTNESIKRLIG